MPAWYTYPRIDNFGQIDPQGNYYKPDTNVLTPPGHPITALLPGLVTSVQRTSWGQEVVTVKLDSAINSLGTHTFFEHMHDATVSVGQRVGANTIVGHANLAGEGANLGFGLYSGDVYGSGSAWDILQRDLAPGGKGLLNPIPIVEAAKGGKTVTLSSMDTSGSNPISDSISGPVQDALTTIKGWGEYVAVFVLAVILIVMGFMLLAGKVG